jgi:hypothetical protein
VADARQPPLGREVNYADDPVDGRVYAILNYAWTDGGGEYFPAVYVYQVNS